MTVTAAGEPAALSAAYPASRRRVPGTGIMARRHPPGGESLRASGPAQAAGATESLPARAGPGGRAGHWHWQLPESCRGGTVAWAGPGPRPARARNITVTVTVTSVIAGGPGETSES